MLCLADSSVNREVPSGQRYGVRRQSEVPTAIWNRSCLGKSKAVSRSACHQHSIELSLSRIEQSEWRAC
jgi:hypothetical protein